MKKNLIAGVWTPGHGVIENLNPADPDDVIGLYAQAEEADVRRAINSAADAFDAWADSSPQVRADLLDAVGSTILARKDELGRLLAREEGKTLAEAIGETVRAGQLFKFFAGEAPALFRRYHRIGAQGRGRGSDTRSLGRDRTHHSLELPHCYSRMEDRPGAGLWQHGCVQTGRADAGLRTCPGHNFA